jgi:probable rRNA maturation factor
VTEDPSKPAVILSDRQDLPVATDPLIHLATATLEAEGASTVELSVSLVGADEMADLHQRYLGEPGPTDVLSFPQDEAAPEDGPRLLGDVVICPEFAVGHGKELQAELRLLLVHGILHLLGYDHEEEAARRAMWARQETYSGVAAP